MKANCAQTEGYNVHAGIRVRTADRVRLAKLVRYILRPPISIKRLGAFPARGVVRSLRLWNNEASDTVFAAGAHNQHRQKKPRKSRHHPNQHVCAAPGSGI